MIRYISDGTWFDKGVECVLLTDCSSESIKMGIFLGTRTCQNPESENRPLGEQYLDEELCGYDEFEIVNE